MNLYYKTGDDLEPLEPVGGMVTNPPFRISGDTDNSSESWEPMEHNISFDITLDKQSAHNLWRHLQRQPWVFDVNQKHIPRKKKKMLKRKICKLIGCKKVIFRYH